MNGDEMLSALSFVDEELITEAQSAPASERHMFSLTWRWIAAACAAIILTVCTWRFFAPKPQPVVTTFVSPTQNTLCLQIAPGRMSAVVRRYDYAALYDAADLVVVADVSQVQADKEIIRFSHLAQTHVVTTLKGDVVKGDILLVRDNNFGETHTTDGGLMLEKGNRVLLFLEASGAEYTYVFGGTGKFFCLGDGRYVSAATYSNSFGGEFSLWSRAELYDYTPRTLDEIKNLL